METVKLDLDFVVKFQQKDVSTQLAPYITSITIVDNLGDVADTVTLELEDTDGRWQAQWYPVKGDEISVAIGYKGHELLDAGTFYIDKIDIKSPPSTVSISGIAINITDTLKTRNSTAYTTCTLCDIVKRVADKHGLTVVGDIDDVTIDFRAQNRQADLPFLHKLASEYGYIMAIKDKKLIFTRMTDIKKTSSNIEITCADCTHYSFTDTTSKVYKACEVRYWNPKTRQMLSYTETASGLNTGDTLVITERMENIDQAKKRAKNALNSANDRQVTGNVNVIGDVQFVAGSQLSLTGFGVLSGIYSVKSATHSFNRSGWTTSLQVMRNELKPDNPRKSESGSGTGARRGANISNISSNPNAWGSITDDDGHTYPCTNETAARFATLQKLVHQRWPGQAFWVSCTTGGTHSSSAHGAGRAIDCGVDGISKQDSYTLESLAQQAGFNTYNEYVNSSTYKTGDHMHIYI